MNILGIIPARAGSVGMPGKNVRQLLGRPVICYTIDAAMSAKRLDRVVVSSNDKQVKEICEENNVLFIDRPNELAQSNSRIDDVLRHCVRKMEKQYDYKADIVVMLYANVPVRADGIIDKAVDHLINTKADSVQTLSGVGKYHPYWLYKLDDDRASKYIDNKIFRRQELPPLYAIDGAVGVMKRECLMAAQGNDNPHAFWGTDRRAVVQQEHETVDIDSVRDFYLAEAALREKVDHGL